MPRSAVARDEAADERRPARGPQLDGYHYLHATRGELLRRLGRDREARDALTRALELARDEAERRLLERRLAGLPPG